MFIIDIVFQGLLILVQLVIEGVLWLLARAAEKLAVALGGGPVAAGRVERLRVRRRNRAIRRWLAKKEPRRPIPRIGLRCPHCEYSLTGLVGNVCPECGQAFDIASMIDNSAGESDDSSREQH